MYVDGEIHLISIFGIGVEAVAPSKAGKFTQGDTICTDIIQWSTTI